MPTAETLRALLALVEEAKGPDRRLDDRLHDGLEQDASFAPLYTTSIDAALALVAKVLPATVRLALVQGPKADWGCALLRVEPDDAPSPHFTAETAPLAILAAVLDALLQQSETAHVER